jgi:hypothetical protein
MLDKTTSEYFSCQARQGRKDSQFVISTKGEIFPRSLAFARDDGQERVTLAPLRSFDQAQDMLCGRHGFSHLFLDSEFQILLADS